MKTIIRLLVCLSLAGCLGKMERITEETKKSVEDTNRKMDETYNGQSLGAAVVILNDRSKSTHMRITSGETVIMLAKEDRLIKYLGGVPGDLKSPDATRKLEQIIVKVPNVSYVGAPRARNEDSREMLGINPIEEVDFDIWLSCVEGLSSQFYLKSKKLPSLSAVEVTEFKSQLERVTHAATIVVGAANARRAKRMSEDATAREYLVSRALRETIAKDIYAANKTAGMDEEGLHKLIVLTQIRTGIVVP